jgi:large subunit ribosomal protein L13
MKTKSISAAQVQRKWWIVDAKDVVLGRAASRIASVLRGKHTPQYTPHDDTGDFVIVINADKVRLTGNKEQNKLYQHHTGWIGHIKVRNAAEMRERNPTVLIKDAVQGMLPKGALAKQMFTKLKVYAGAEHPHAAQKPEPLAV